MLYEKYLIVEDETAAYENLADMLVTIDPTLRDHGKYGECPANGTLAASQSEAGFDFYGYSFIGWFRFRYF